MKQWFFLAGLGFISAHELDAVAQHEWRLLYVLRVLPEPLAQQVFIALHVPLFALLVWVTHHPRRPWREGTRLALMGFLIIHVGLHLRLSGEALYRFDSLLSKALIFGGGLCGVLYLCLAVRSHWRRS